MSLSPTLFAAASLSLVLASSGCSSSSSSSSYRSLVGQVDAHAFSLDNPKVVARTSDGRRFFAPLERTGAFRLRLPVGLAYTLAIANTARDGSLREISTITWRGTAGRAHTMALGAGADVQLGLIRPVVAAGQGLGTRSHGSDDSSADGRSSSTSSGSSSSAGASSSSSSADDDSELESCVASGEADLPCNYAPALGSSFELGIAFLSRGPRPSAILDVSMSGDWRLAELKAGTAFIVTQADCDHAGNSGAGRDRVLVTWKNADGSTRTDKIDLRYCDGSNSSSGGGGDRVEHEGCEDHGDSEVCVEANEVESECEHEDHDGLAHEGGGQDDEHEGMSGATCAASTPAPIPSPAPAPSPAPSPTPSPVPPLAACVTNADCSAGLFCFSSRCEPIVL